MAAGGEGGLHSLKKRIKGIRNTRKVTQAMEAVSASKMRKAVAKTLASRSYASLGWELIEHLSATLDVSDHPLLVRRPVKKSLLLIYTPDRGLCGGMNTQLFRRVSGWLEAKKSRGVEVQFISIGKKAQNFVRRLGRELSQTYIGLGDKPSSLEIRPAATYAMSSYQNGEVDEVVVAFTDFKSTLTQTPVIRTLLPFSGEVYQTTAGESVKWEPADTAAIQPVTAEARTFMTYLFEPDKQGILNNLLPRLVEVQVFQALLESVASEHSSRMVAMRNATDAASDMINDLTLTFNQARQAGITQEIAEISAGRLALEA